MARRELARAVESTDQDWMSQDYKTSNREKGCHLIVNIESMAPLASVKFFIEGYNIAGENYYKILESQELTTAGTHILKVYPGVDSDLTTINDSLPYKFRVRTETNGMIEYGVAINLLQ